MEKTVSKPTLAEIQQNVCFETVSTKTKQEIYGSITTLIPSECDVNSGAYMHWMVVMPFE